MAIRINYNPMSALTNANLATSNQQLTTSLGRLSSGLRIRQASDDPAAMVVANAVRYYRSGVDRASANAEEGITMLQTAESSMDQITQVLQRCRTLALNAASTATQDPSQLAATQGDFDNAIGSITTIATQASFGGNLLLDGTLRGASLSNAATANHTGVGIDWTKLPGGMQNGSTITINPVSGAMTRSQALQSFAPATPDTTVIGAVGTVTITGPKGSSLVTVGPTSTIGGVVAQINAVSSLTGAIAAYDQATGNLTVESTAFGNSTFAIASTVAGFLTAAPTAAANQSLVLSYIDGAGVTQTLTLDQDPNSAGGLTFTNLGGGPNGAPPYVGFDPGALSVTVKDTSSGGIGAQIQPAGAVFTATRTSTAAIQIGALASQRVALEIPDLRAAALGSSAGLAAGGLASLQDLVTSGALANGNAGQAITLIDAALSEILAARGAVGAMQGNTLDPALSSLQATSVNLTDFEGILRDTDMAQESTNFARLQIMLQAATAMLAQANQVPQTVLQLLK